MSAKPKYCAIFSRPVEPADEKIIAPWLAADPVHQALGLKFSDVMADGYESHLIMDRDENPLLAIRLGLALRVAMQFNPATPIKTARHANLVMGWLEDMAREFGANELISRPGGKAVNFVEKLGWTDFDGKVFKVSL